MPVRFHCPECHQLLSVGSRKIGTTVICPKCAAALVVPEEGATEAVSTSLPAAPPVIQPELPEKHAEFVVYDDFELPGDLAGKRGAAAVSAPPVPPPELAIPPPPLPARANERSPLYSPAPAKPARSYLLVTRRTLYFQAVLFAIVAAASFGTGFLVGFGVAPEEYELAMTPGEVTLQGNVGYRTPVGQVMADTGAVVIVVPRGRLPNPKIAFTGLRPEDPMPAAGAQAILALEELGGRYTRCDAQGNYRLQLPQRGEYFVCFISMKTNRPKDTLPDEFQLALVNRYFNTGDELIGPHKFVWQSEDLRDETASKSFDFGKSGE